MSAGTSDRSDGLRVRLPEVAGRTLMGDDVTLPRDLPAERTLVVVAFERWQQERVDLWIERAVAAGVPGTPRGRQLPMQVAVVELPVLSTRWRPARRFIDGGMTAGIRDPDVLARTITVYTDAGSFRRTLGIPSSDDVWAYVVLRDGTVRASAHGEPDDTAWEPLEAALLG